MPKKANGTGVTILIKAIYGDNNETTLLCFNYD